MNGNRRSANNTTKSLQAYSAPTTGLVSHLPPGWIPFAELARIDKPTGIYLFYAPHLFGTLYAAAIGKEQTDIANIVLGNCILFVGTVFFRSSACAWNDNLDQEYDRQVLRCRLRPIARYAVTPNQAHVFTVISAILAGACLYILPPVCWLISVPSIFLLGYYPLAKRHTDFPQVILGFQVAIGFFMGLFSISPDLIDIWEGPMNAVNKGALAAFYVSCICWTIIYDTVYAQQDVEDDAKAGVRSMAVYFRDGTKPLLWFASIAQVALLLLTGYLQDFGANYMAVACAGTMLSLGYMNLTIDLSKPSECLWWFQMTFWFVGTAVSAGLILEGMRI